MKPIPNLNLNTTWYSFCTKKSEYIIGASGAGLSSGREGVKKMKTGLRVFTVFAALIAVFGATTGSAHAAGHTIPNVPLYGQQRNLSCEYASARMVTAYWGKEIGEGEFIDAIGFNPDPHIGFRGDIDADAGWVDDYGIYAEPIANYLNTKGFRTKLLADANDLRHEIDRSHPVIVWTTIGMGYAQQVKRDIKELPVTLVPEEHASVVVGYDEGGIVVNGPASGGVATFGWDEFNRAWGYFGNMALSVWPSDQTASDTPGVSALFYRYYTAGGSASAYGRPTSGERVEEGKVIQDFERVRMEYDPRTGVVQIGEHRQPDHDLRLDFVPTA